jgi:Fungal rhodopsin domain
MSISPLGTQSKKVMGLIYPILRRLKIDLKRKMVLFGLFSLGIFSLMCNIGRSIALLRPPFIPGYFWATAETTVAIVCASIPAIRPLFDKKAWVRQTGVDGSLGASSDRSKTTRSTDSEKPIAGEEPFDGWNMSTNTTNKTPA